MQDNPNQEKSSSDELGQALARLSTDQIRFVVARQEFSTDKEAAQEIGVKPDTVYQWKHRGVPIDEAVRLMAADGVVVALELRRRNLAKAMAVKVAGLNSKDEAMRQRVATEIAEWELGKAPQHQRVDVNIASLDAAIERELEKLATGGEAETAGETSAEDCCGGVAEGVCQCGNGEGVSITP